MRVALVVAGKELRQRMRDRTALLIGFVAPVVLATIVSGAFGSGFGPGSQSTLHIPIVVADADHSRLSNVFFTQVLGSPQLRKQLAVKTAASASEAQSMVAAKGFDAAFVVPQGFQSSVQSGARAQIQVIRNQANPIVGDIAEAIATSFTEQISAGRVAVFTALRAGGGQGDIAKLAAAVASERMPVQLVDGDVAARHITGASYFGPGMSILFLFFVVGAGARSLLAEREQGTMPRVLAAPGPRSSIILGKALAILVLGLASMTTMFVFMGVVFHVQWGDPLAIGALTIFIVLALMSVTSLVQTLARTEAQAASYGSMVGTLFALVGGSFFPLFQMPAFLQKVSALTPNGWAMRGFTDVAYDGAKIGSLLPNLGAMAAFIVVCGSIAAMRARRITLA